MTNAAVQTKNFLVLIVEYVPKGVENTALYDSESILQAKIPQMNIDVFS